MNSLMQYTNGSLIPSPRDLVLVLPRLAQRAGAFAFYTVPEQIDGLMGKMKGSGGSIIAERTAAEKLNATASNTTKLFLKGSSSPGLMGMATATAAQASAAPSDLMGESIWSLQTIRNLGGMFSYLMTRWALGTFFVSILLNRTQFYASSRTPLRLRWYTRLALYLIPIIVLASQALKVLQATRCQSSPHWALMRYGDADKNISMDYAGEGGPLYYLASFLLFWQTEPESCAAVNMANPEAENLLELSGSLTLLWPLFLTLCLSQFVETLACALQGRQPLAETGMTIFEHSLAFCEAEAMLIRPWELAGKVAGTGPVLPADAVDRQITRTFLKGFMNIPPEILVLCLISTLSHLSSNVLAVLNMRKRCRLINTSVWALSYMSAFVWSVYRFVNTPFTADSTPTTAISIGLIRFPTVCIVGFIPHLVIFCGILVCAIVYGLAFLITVASPPEHGPQPTSIKERFAIAYQNLQANVHLSAGTPISVAWQDDFYTSLLKVGFAILTSASEAVYLNEGIQVQVSPMTWLEKKRHEELVRSRGVLYKKTVESIPQDLRRPAGIVAVGSSSSDGEHGRYQTVTASGYAVERKGRSKDGDADTLNAAGSNDRGVGFMQRHWRWAMSLRFIKGIFWLAISLNARCIVFLLGKLGIERCPDMLVRLAGPRPTRKTIPRVPIASTAVKHDGLNFWMLDDDGSLSLPHDDNIDVEAEMRRRIASSSAFAPDTGRIEQEAFLADQTYNWWKAGGWWGDVDSSGNYAAPSDADDDDTTSMISMSTNATTDGNDDEWHTDEEDGRRTPTQRYPHTYSREKTPSDGDIINDAIEPLRLAELLDPQNVDQRNEARILARHLRNDTGPLTRSRYSRQIDLDRSRILSSNTRQRSKFDAMKSAEEEEMELERFILERRSKEAESQAGANQGWQGPPCVVCQHNQRTILAWPCGCLSMCDECRIGLATRNYNNCICCRTGVSAFSRIWVP